MKNSNVTIVTQYFNQSLDLALTKKSCRENKKVSKLAQIKEEIVTAQIKEEIVTNDMLKD